MEKKAAAGVVVLLLGTAACRSDEPEGERTEAKETVLRVGSFGGLAALPIGLGDREGFYAARGLKIEVEWFRRTEDLTDALAGGALHVAHGPADAVVSLVEDQGADAVLVLGGSDGMNELVVRSEVKSLRGLRGKTVLADPGNPAYTLLLRKLLSTAGLVAERDYKLIDAGSAETRMDALQQNPGHVATLLTPPLTFFAEVQGLKSLGPVVNTIGPYQGMSAMVQRPWAEANRGLLERYLAGWVQALRFALDPQNKSAVLAFLTETMHIKPEYAARTWELLTSGKSGLTVDSQLDEQGMQNTLAIRAETEPRWEGKAPPPERYLDLSYYRSAVASLDKRP